VVDDDTISSDRYTSREILPVLAGIEAVVATRRGSRVRQPSKKAVMAASNDSTAVTESPSAPTNIEIAPESSKDFAARMKSRFVLKGPRPPDEATEGGNTSTEPTESATENMELTLAVPPTEGTLINIVSQSL